MTTPFSQNDRDRIYDIKIRAMGLINRLGLDEYEGCFVIAGSYINSMLNSTGCSDVNFFFLDNKAVHSNFDKLDTHIVGKLPCNRLSLKSFRSEYPGLIGNSYTETFLGTAVNHCITGFASREELVSHFDFEHCTIHYFNKMLYMSKNAFDCTIDKQLVIRAGRVADNKRINSMVARGYTPVECPTSVKKTTIDEEIKDMLKLRQDETKEKLLQSILKGLNSISSDHFE